MSMRVLHIVSSLGRGGRERQLFELVKGLQSEIQVSLIILNDLVHYPISEFHFPILKISKAERTTFAGKRQIYSHIKQFKPDIIQYWDNLSAFYAISSLVFHRSNLIDGSIRSASKRDYPLPAIFVRAISFYTSKAIVGNSQAGLRVAGVKNRPKARVIYNGMDFSRFTPDKTFDAISTGLRDNLVKIVMVAGFRTAKDHESIVYAAKELQRNGITAQFVFIGDGPNRPHIESLISGELHEFFLFMGWRRDVEQILMHCDIGVLLTNTNGNAEGLSNSIMEYMYASLPVVATNAGGTPEIVIDGENGYLVEGMDVAGIAKALKNLIIDSQLRKLMGSAGKQRIISNFSMKALLQNHLSLYNSVLLKGSR